MPRPIGSATASGYGHPSYAASFAEFGTPRRLTRSGGWLLERSIPHAEARDAMGCYPLFVCQDWRGLEADLDEIDDLVSVSLVTDPFGDHDEALLRILYSASGNPVLVSTINTLWQHCRAYKLVGAQGTLDAADADSLWRYQEDLLAAAREQDGAAALAVSDASLDNATQRIRSLLAAQQDEASAAGRTSAG